MDLIDNTDFLENAMGILELGELLKARLDEIPDKTPDQEATYEAIMTVVNVQADAIRRLVLHQTEITDMLNRMITTHHL